MTEPFRAVDLSYFLIGGWRRMAPQIIAGFSTRLGGFSKGEYESNNFGFHVDDDPNDVFKNRTSLAEKLAFPLNRWVFAQQIHGDCVRFVGKSEEGKGADQYGTGLSDTDGLYTDVTGIMLALVFADCVPVYFFSPADGKVGIAHAGWRGTVKQTPLKLLEKWKGEGTSMGDVHVAIGPSICNTCYIVDNKVIKQVDSLLLPDPKVYNKIGRNQFALDLKKMNYMLLRRYGIPEENIVVTEYCTSCHSRYFYSHRRDQGRTGRMVGFIGIRED